MNSQRLLLLVLVVLAAAGGLFLLSTDPGSEGDETLPLALGEEPLEPTEPEESTELAPAALASEDGGGRTSARVDVDAANARQVEVVVTMPAGAPRDASLVAVAVEREDLGRSSWRNWLSENPEAGSRGPVGADGRASISVPNDAEDVLVFLAGDYLFVPSTVALEGDRVELEAVLGGRLQVSFDTAGTGGGAPAGEIGMLGANMGGGRGGFTRVEQPADGPLDFKALPTDVVWTIQPNLDGVHAASQMGLSLEPGKTQSLVVQVSPGATVEGVVVDEDGQPLADVTVRSVSAMPWMGGGGASTDTDAEGRFQLAGLEPGELQLRAERDNFLDTNINDLELADGAAERGLKVVLRQGASLGGRVVLPTGEGAAGADVAVQASRSRGWGGWGGGSRLQTVANAVADADGRFVVRGLDEGNYTLRASFAETEAEDAPRWRAELSPVESGRMDCVLELAAPVQFTGVVLDDRGEPVTAFEVRVSSTADGGPRETQAFESEDGSFTFARVGEGDWSVRVTAEGHVQDEELPLVLPSSAQLDVALLRTGRMSGRVVDGAGGIVMGAEVKVDDGRGGGNPWGGQTGPSAITDAEGLFELEDLRPGALVLTASAEGWADSEDLAIELAPGQESDGLDLALRVGAIIEGTVLTPEGDPMPGRRVSWGSNAMGFGNRDEVMTDAAGRFRFEHVTPGTWSVSASPSMAEMGERMRGKRGQSAFVEVMGELVTETVTLDDRDYVEVFLGGEPKMPVRITGVVTRGEEPFAGAQVYAVSEGSAVFEGMKTSTADENGAFEIILDRPGPHVISAREGSLGVERLVEVPRQDEMRVDLHVPSGALLGTVRSPDGKPVTGIRLSIQREDGMGRMRWGGDQARTNETGSFRFDGLEAGRYTVRANVSSWNGSAEDRYASTIQSGIELGEDELKDRVDFKLALPGRVSGLVRDQEGRPVAGASIFFRDAAGRMVSMVSSTTTNSAGEYEKTGLEPGTYAISARSEDAAANDAAEVDVRADEESKANLTVEIGTTLVVTLEDEDGSARRARIQILDKDGNEVGGMMTTAQLRAIFNSGASPLSQRLGPLPPGRYTVRATTLDGKVFEERARVSGRTKEKDVKLKLEG